MARRKAIKVTGLDRVVRGLNESLKKIENKTVAGLLEAAILVRGESQRITPVDTGNLRASAYIVYGGGDKTPKARAASSFKVKKKKAGGQAVVDRLTSKHKQIVEERKGGTGWAEPFAEVGYTAYYAVDVHEAPAGRTFKVGQSKFLEQALRNNSRNIFKIIQRRASII
jgi:hypothetical protein|tara:strand:- start:270 stop:776 length:507 start_codon:yes stop_codon:yes gene_type:complete